jgi:hypothetical protein
MTTCSEYSTAFTTDRLQHNLVRIIDGAGRLYLENDYGRDSGQPSFNRVVRQRQGGGETIFEYGPVRAAFDRDYAEAERPVLQTTVIQWSGQTEHHVYNAFGNLLFSEEWVVDGGIHRLLIERYRYNRDGNLVASLSSEGVLTQHLYGREDFIRRHGVTDEDALAARKA